MIAAAYADGQTLKILAERYQVSLGTIRCWVAEMGVAIRPRFGQTTKTRPQGQIERINAAWALYERGATMREVASAYCVSAQRVSQWFRSINKQPRPALLPHRAARRQRQKIVPDWVRPAYERYLSGATYAEAAASVGRHASTLRLWLRVLNVLPCTPRHAHYHRKLTPEQRLWIAKQYGQGRSGYELAKELDVTNRTIYNCLRRQGIPVRPPHRYGEREESCAIDESCSGDR